MKLEILRTKAVSDLSISIFSLATVIFTTLYYHEDANMRYSNVYQMIGLDMQNLNKIIVSNNDNVGQDVILTQSVEELKRKPNQEKVIKAINVYLK